MANVPSAPLPVATSERSATIAADGIVAGVLGAVTVAAWFLALDTIAGRPFYTPSVLGTALFRRGAGLEAAETLPVALDMVGMFTWVHALVFVALGGLASYLIAEVERRPTLGFGVLLLFVIFQAGFTAAALVLAAPLLKAIGWVPLLTANLLAASVMAAYLGWRHRALRILP